MAIFKMGRIKQRTTQKQSVKLKTFAIVSVALISVTALVFVLIGSLSSTKSSANSDVEITLGSEYWLVNSIEPASFKNSLQVNVKSRFEGSLVLKLYSTDKDLLIKESMHVSKGDNTYRLNDLNMLPKGDYVIELSGEDKTISNTVYKN